MTVAQFFLLAPLEQERIWRMQQKCLAGCKARFPDGPPYYLAINDGSRMLYPLMPDGSFIREEA